MLELYRVRVSVVDTEGLAVPGAPISVERSGAGATVSLSSGLKASGTFDIAPGSWVASASVDGTSPVDKSFEVFEGKYQYDAELVLDFAPVTGPAGSKRPADLGDHFAAQSHATVEAGKLTTVNVSATRGGRLWLSLAPEPETGGRIPVSIVLHGGDGRKHSLRYLQSKSSSDSRSNKRCRFVRATSPKSVCCSRRTDPLDA